MTDFGRSEAPYRNNLVMKLTNTGIDATTSATCTASTIYFQTELRTSQGLGGRWVLRETIAGTGGSGASAMTGIAVLNSEMFQGRTDLLAATTGDVYKDRMGAVGATILIPFEGTTGGGAKNWSRQSYDSNAVIMDLTHAKRGIVRCLIDKVGSTTHDTLYNADLELTLVWQSV